MSGCYNCSRFWLHPCSSRPFCKWFIASIIDPWAPCDSFDLATEENTVDYY